MKRILRRPWLPSVWITTSVRIVKKNGRVLALGKDGNTYDIDDEFDYERFLKTFETQGANNDKKS